MSNHTDVCAHAAQKGPEACSLRSKLAAQEEPLVLRQGRAGTGQGPEDQVQVTC